MDDKQSEITITCRECQAGHLQQKFISYFTWMGDEMIIVPDFPAWICDVCGRREYDPQALSRLNLLLNPNAGKPFSRSHKPPAQPEGKSPHPTLPE
jgi:YgiT-type zinc finger domain-containing protein